MAKFKVVVDRVEYLTTTIIVEADNIGLAEEIALNECYNDQVDWDCYDSDGPTIDFAQHMDDDNNDDYGNFAYAC